MSKHVAAVVVAAALGCGAPGAAAQEAAKASGGEGEFGVLVPGEGAEETYIYCSACHSERLVAQQGLTRRGWEDLLEWMVEEQGMTPLEEPERSLILDYLARNYGPDRPNFPY